MLVVVSDTHGTADHRLRGRTLDAVREADLVVHAGDFMTEPVLDAFEAAAADLIGVYGNNDDAAIRERLPADRTFEYAGVRFALTHGHGTAAGVTGLSLFGRQRDAAVVISGHTHRPGVDDDGAVTLVNPGSHAEPRGFRPAHAELTPADDADTGADAGTAALTGRLVTPDGDAFERFRVEAAGNAPN
jgi:putative phosphoesterase